MANAAYTDTVQKVFIAYYGRAADPVGLAFWEDALATANGDLSAIMANFGTSAEATALFGSLDNTAKVAALYQQMFGRTPDDAGSAYYVAQLGAGTMTAASIAQSVSDGATGDDATILTNKLAVAKAYTTAINTADEISAYAGDAAASTARTLLATVDATTATATFDVATSVASIVSTAAETAAVSVYDAALVTHTAAVATYDAAVVTAAASKAAADTAAATVSTVVLATASQTAAATAVTDAAAVGVAAAVVTSAAAALTTSSAATASATDDTASATSVAAAATAAAAAAVSSVTATASKTTADAAIITATAADAVAAETAKVAAYDAALVTYNAAVVTAAASKVLSDAADDDVVSVANATASKTTATTSDADARAVVVAAAALTTTAAATPSIIDDAAAVTNTASAAAAATLAATALTTATAAVVTATAAAATAAATGNTKALTTATDSTLDFLGSAKSDTYTATQLTYNAADSIIDISAIDNDVLTVTATDDVAATATVTNVETVNFNLNASGTPAATTTVFNVAADNIAKSTINLAVTKAVTTVTAASITALATDVTVATALNTLTAASAANSDNTINLTSTAASALTHNGTGDNLTINASGNLTVADANNEEALVIIGAGTVTVTDLTPIAKTANTTNITAATGITITDSNSAGNMDLTATAGNITITDGAGHGNQTGGSNLTMTALAGNIVTTIAGVDAMAGVVTATATGNVTDVSTTNDGDITLYADAATSAVITATGGVAATELGAAVTVTIGFGEASTLDGTAAAITTLNLSSTNASASAANSTITAGTGGTALNAVDNINFTGSNDVNLIWDSTDLTIAAASTAGSTTAAAVIATDNSTGTSRITLAEDLAATTHDVSKMAVDEIGLGATSTMTGSLTLASGANVVVGADQIVTILTAAAVAGNTATLTINDDSTATDTNSYNVATLTSTNIATLTLALNDTEETATVTTVGVGTANKMVVTGAGDLTIGTSFTGLQLDASDSTGIMSVQLVNTIATDIKGGSGNDIFTTDATAAAYTIDGGAGVDTLVGTIAADDYSALALSLTNIEKLDMTAVGAFDIFSGAQMTGKDYLVVGDGAIDGINVTALSSTGEVIDLADFTTSIASLTLTGLAGGDTLTGSSVSATIINAAAGNDTIVGGAGIDTITPGTGVDAINITDVNTNSDIIITTVGAAYTAAAADTVTGFTLGSAATGGDNLDVADADVVASGNVTLDLVNLDDSISLIAGASIVTNITAAFDLDNVTAGTDTLAISGSFADAAALETALETGGTRALTFSLNGMTAKDSFLAVWSDGTDSYVSIVEAGAISVNALAAAGTLDVINIVKLAGITDVSGFHADNLDVI